MNIFFTDIDVSKCATSHCTVHVRKMIVEYAQLLSTAHHVLDKDSAICGLYKKTHENHPCAIWVRQSANHYNWLYCLFMAVCDLYTQGTGKTHKTARLLPILAQTPSNIDTLPFRYPPQCMPDEHKHTDTTIAYKKYLTSKYQEWESRQKPIKVAFYK